MIAALLATSAPAAARERDVPGAATTAGAGSAPTHRHLHDTILEDPAPSLMRAADARATARAYATPDGRYVTVEVSRAYPVDPEVDQALVDFLGSRLHGPELETLSVYVGAPREISRLCGARDAVACYAPYEERMFVPGEAVHGVSVDYALTHEYGHHVASWRSNRPWNALDWGAKHWSSAMRVCTQVDRGLLFPGNQGRHYFEDPGEGFADGYAHVHYPGFPWGYSPLMRPRGAAYAAIRRDVLHPWTGPRTRILRGRLRPGGGARSFRLRLRLDGDVTVRLSAPERLRAAIELKAAGVAAGRRLRDGRAFGVEWCRREPIESVTLTVRRRAGAGPFALKVAWPG